VIVDQLKSRTSAAHSSLEERLRLACPRPSLGDYEAYLAAMYGFSAPLEARYRQLPPELAQELRIERRCKAALLEADLASLAARRGAGTTRPPLCERLPSTDTVSRTLGTLYVLEGSTLGARFLLRHLEPLGIEDCSSYLRSYGPELKPMWEGFRNILTSHAERHPEQVEELLDAALQTFSRIDAWFVQCGAAEESRAA
jgi:heme oxygenase (biliverdin-IX-beta and delta-forming)